MKWRDPTDEDVRAATPIPVSYATEIAIARDKRIVVIIAIDARAVVWTTTYGVEVEDKLQAARLGETLTASVGSDLERRVSYEDFRTDGYAAIGKVAIDHADRTGECLFCEYASRTKRPHAERCPVGQWLSGKGSIP